MASWPQSLPDWKLPLSHKADEGVLRTNMSVGPAKLRKRYSAVPTQFQTSFWCDGIQQQILQGFYNQNQASEFERIDPVTGDTQYFRFLTSPEFRTRVGAKLPSERQYEVTLSLERMPGSPDKAFTVLIDEGYANSLINFTRSSPAWYFGSDGLLKEAAVDAMRFDYDPATGELLGLLIEEARTNSLLDSLDPSTANWGGGGVTFTTGKSSIFTGEKAVQADDDGGGTGRNYQQSVGTFSGDPETCSVIIENGDAVETEIRIRDNTSGSFLESGVLNWENETFTGNGIAEKLSDSGPNGGKVFRISLTVTGISGNDVLVYVYPSSSNIASEVTIYHHHAQYEQASFPSSPIITKGTTVTRSADVPTITDLSWYNQQEGTFVVELGSEPARTGNILNINDGGSSNRVHLFRINGNSYRFQVYDGGTQQADITGGSISETDSLAISYKRNDISLIVNGSIVGIDNSATIPTINQVILGSTPASTNFLNGHIKRLHYYPERLPNAKLQELTR